MKRQRHHSASVEKLRNTALSTIDQRGRNTDVVVLDRLCKSYSSRTLTRESLVENLFRWMSAAKRPNSSVHALTDINLRVARNESIGVVGGNGAGKSTLLKIIAGIAAASSGKIEVRGRISTQLAAGSGFNPFLTVSENVFLLSSILGATNRRTLTLMPSILELAGLESAADRPLGTLSNGTVCRLGFAVAVHADFDLLLLDEALSAVDNAFRARYAEALLKVRSSGKAMIIVSHGAADLAELCDRVAWLEQGRIRALGAPREILDQYENSRWEEQASERAVQKL